MPNRVLRDWTESDRVDALSWPAECFFTRLIMKVDDYGRFFAEGRRLRAYLFPLRVSLTEADCVGWLAECERAGLVRCYEAGGKRFLEIVNFRQRLRQMREIYPRPPLIGGPLSGDSPLPPDGHLPAVGGQPTVARPLESETKIETEPESESEGESDAEVEAEAKGRGFEAACVLQKLETGLNTAYQRTWDSPWTYAEQSQLAEIARRPAALMELEMLLAHRRRLPGPEKRFFPNSVGSLLAKWTDVLDQARISRPEPLKSRPPPPLPGEKLSEEQRLKMAAQLAETRRKL